MPRSPAAPNPIRQARLAQGLSLHDVAEQAGVDVGQLSRVERGLGGLSMASFLRVARVLDLRWRGAHLATSLEPFVTQEKEPAA